MSSNFVIITPAGNESVQADGGDQVLVRVRNDDPDVNTGFAATIVDINDTPGDGVFLPREGNTQYYSAPIGAATVPDAEPPSNNNKVNVVAWEDEVDTDAKLNEFKASHKDTGTPSGSFSAAPVVLAKFYADDQPVPIALSLKLGSKVSKGTCTNHNALNKRTQLLYSHNPKEAGRWISAPIDLGEEGSLPAFWVLKKKDAKTWLLVLQRKKTVIVKYRLKTKIAKDCSFPIKLQQEGTAGKQFKKWPKTITISSEA